MTFTFTATATSTASPSSPQPSASGLLPYWVENSLTRVQPTASPGTTTAAAISAAQNEYESFQVIVHAPESVALVGVNGYATDLTGPGGTLLPSANVILYREHYVQVTTSSPGSPYPPGYWPDALIPFLNPETGQPLSGGRFPAAPFDVPMGTNQPIYVEVYVPAGMAPGVYTGSVALTAAGYSSTAIPVTLRVRNFSLPQRASLRSNFTPYAETSNAANYFGLTYGSQEYWATVDRFNSILSQHRLSPDMPSGTAPYLYRSTGHIDTTDSHPRLRHHFEDLHATSWALPFGATWPWPDPTGADSDKAATYLTDMAAYLTANGWFSKTYIYLYDEPRSAAAYATIRDIAAFIHSVRPDFRVLVTEQTTPRDPTWGTLNGAVDTWVPLFSLFDEPSASAAIASGNEVWAYAEGSAAPQWQVDFPLLNYRVPSWIEWRYGQTGLLYWTPWLWEQTNPWDSTATDVRSYATYNDNGVLVYPGNDVGYTNGPIASLRLKALRDGMEDYEYLKLLSDLGDSATSAAEALGIGTGWTGWDPDPLALEAARDRLASQIEAQTGALR